MFHVEKNMIRAVNGFQGKNMIFLFAAIVLYRERKEALLQQPY